MFPGPLGESITGSALKKNLFSIQAINIRDFAKDNHKTVDDMPYGGGAGMVLKADVLGDAIESVINFDDKNKVDCHASLAMTKEGNIAMTEDGNVAMMKGEELVAKEEDIHASSRSFCKKTVAIHENEIEETNDKNNKICKPKIIYLSPRGKRFTQKIARELAKEKEIILICGRYEGVDQRVLDEYEIEELSIGDYVLSGGEIASYIVIDAIVRNIDGVLGADESLSEESFGAKDDDEYSNLLEYPHYTRPQEWKNRKVPEMLLSGHHKKIQEWRKEQAIKTTKKNRPDLIEK